MADLPTIATLWVGGSLSWLERLCLKSFVDAGHHTILYTYEEVEGVPEGVERRDGRTILEGKPTYKHARSGSVAPFADIFRFHMMRKAPGLIWVDTDVYCWKPLIAPDDHVFGYERPRRINSAVLRLPPDSDALGQFLEFMEDEFPIPPFLSKAVRAEYRAAAEAGAPVHVADMPWGLWGPVGLSFFLKQTGEVKYARERTVYYPVPYPHRNLLFKKPKKVMPMLAADTEAVHLWSPIKRFSAGRFGGYAPHSSFLWHRLRHHGIDVREGRVMRYGDREFDHTAFDENLAAAQAARAEAEATAQPQQNA
ncbi:MAG: hypothetical protein AAFN79_19440 [Pseudomonadota bacterium]